MINFGEKINFFLYLGTTLVKGLKDRLYHELYDYLLASYMRVKKSELHT